ncbi:MAG TPA: DUF3014 domain-containing protein [Geopsychrobacteraceae bacterium]|nr:DUF3014 domain-containing protein [Geopsychrobacteraceae bacterium]
MKSFILWSAALVILLGLALFFYQNRFFETEEEPALVSMEEPTPEPVKPVVKYPVPKREPVAEQPSETEQAEVVVEPPPSLLESDKTLQETLNRMLKEQKLLALLHLKNFIQRFVVTVDRMTEKQLSQHHLPVTAPEGKFQVSGGSISPQNANRYTPYLQLIETIGIDPAVSIYVYYYELFQEAYRELGAPQAHFNDRFVVVIDHLLETPDVKEPIGVIQPMIVYKFADPELEGLSAGQKLLLRIGADNRAKVKAILENLRRKLTTLGDVARN